MKAEIRLPSLTLLLVTLATTACGNPVDTLPPDETAGTGGTSATGGTTMMGGTGGTSGSSGGSAGSTAGASPGGAAGSAGSSGGGAGSGGSSSVTPVTWQEMSFTVNDACAKSKCHNGMQDPPLLAIPAMTQYMMLTTHPITFCGTATRLVAPGNPANSAILKLVNGECLLDGEPFLMPADCTQAPCLPAAQITTITNWILSGAPGPL